MGYYINPVDCEKEEWLAKHGVEVTVKEVTNFSYRGDVLPVCLIGNGSFSIAGILFDAKERSYLLPGSERDRRPKRWFIVPKHDLEPWYRENAEIDWPSEVTGAK